MRTLVTGAAGFIGSTLVDQSSVGLPGLFAGHPGCAHAFLPGEDFWSGNWFT
jgi:hypothetical protein